MVRPPPPPLPPPPSPQRRAPALRPAAGIDALVEVLEACCDPGAADDVLGHGFGARVGELRDRLRRAELAATSHSPTPDSPQAAELVALRRQARRLEDELMAVVAEVAERLDRAWEDTDSARDEADGRWLLRHLPPGACDEARALKAELAAAIEALEARLPSSPG
ncbi:hypothetical protein L6R53_08700 [Myxococcota bacterium]|nr:hypothetical protein [Myxococcota bacterium]